mgnify:CR=1 FL=1
MTRSKTLHCVFERDKGMREVDVNEIIKNIKEMCIEANHFLSKDMKEVYDAAAVEEESPLGRQILGQLQENLQIAGEDMIPICQDTGMAVIFCDVGQDVHIVGGDFENAVNEGVSRGYTNGLLRKSIVRDPLDRVNTNDNTPAVIHTRIVPGDKIKLTVAPKGFGSENMSRLKMFTPSASKDDLMDFVLETVKLAGGNPCPPMVIGIGFGGDFEYCAYLAKKALCRPVSERNKIPVYRDMEQELLRRINATNIGPQGFGGRTTCLGLAIEQMPTHVAGLPVAVNVSCHVTRRASAAL